ncbi:P-type conjugative transfer protein TrbG [Erythrobacter rubeus]|uniref:P-type conjugative transfer protein TrbG n=1 Tax=Erythrobacter rubeus TaxID=2760803 RepID=A0ABR8KRY7_9SPHN|nr:P-type conjugative transfer protein TrbG [Erythrobacter rubeus]MBD2843527.1 P-type conjugative transfer protein TrbG [Erythrobacter rubeus]
MIRMLPSLCPLALGACAGQVEPPAIVSAPPEEFRLAIRETEPPSPIQLVETPVPTPVAMIEPPREDLSRPVDGPPRAQVEAANRDALREPTGDGYRRSVQIYPYAEGALYRLYAAPERVTDIMLQPGERVTSVAAGDTVRWTVGDTASGSGETRRVHILVKPFAPGLATNLVITTDRRAYHLQLQSTETTAMAAIRWTYPQDELITLRRAAAEAERVAPIASGLAIDQLDFDYTIEGDDPSWRPLRAFDDGRRVFVEFPASIATGEAPPLFVLGTEGDAELVNYRVRGRFYIVDRLFAAAELRLGGRDQKVVRIVKRDARRRRR